MKGNNLKIDNSTIIGECKKGDANAMSLLYTRFAPRMLHVINRYVKDKEDAKDILHDGFIAAFGRIDSIHDPDRVEYWLATIMKNLSLKFLQSQNVASILDEIPDIEDDPEIDELIDFETLEKLIMQLPDGYRKVFRLAVLENKSHKEISKILGIAPNSSSSQLFHAKLMLRKLVAEYKQQTAFMSMLLIAASVGIFFLARYKANDITDKPLLVSAERIEEITDNSNESKISAVENIKPDNSDSGTSGASETANNTRTANVSIVQNTSENAEPSSSIIQPATQQDKISESGNVSEIDNVLESEDMPDIMHANGESPIVDTIPNPENYLADIRHKDLIHKGWSAGINFDSGILNFDQSNSSNYSDLSAGPHPSDSEDESNKPDNNGESNVMDTRARECEIADELDSQSHRNYLPITFGITAEKRINTWLGLESGVSYTYLRTDFEYMHSTIRCNWHYLEIPLKVNMYAFNTSRFSFYGSVSGKLSIPVYSNAQVPSASIYRVDKGGRFRSNPVWSAGGSIGISYRLSERINLYVEPSLQYHFRHEFKVPNLWTDDPWSFSIPIGIRFNW